MKVGKKYLCMLLAAVLICVSMTPVSVRAKEDGKIKIEQTRADLQVMPDRYNTGVSGNLIPFSSQEAKATLPFMAGGQSGELILKKSGEANTYNITFDIAENRQLSGKVDFYNYDFSGYKLNTLGTESVDHKITLAFHNCKFGILAKEYLDSNVTYEFYNCTIRRFFGSNARFEKCYFGGSYEDPLVPFRHVEVLDSYVADLNYASPDRETHIDGTQIYGYSYMDKKTGETVKSDVEDIRFSNCRFEVPNILLEGANKATVNACVMLQLEYADGHNITVEDCLLNGGSQTIFAHCKKDYLKMDNVLFKNIKIGSAKYNGHLYQDIDEHVTFENFSGVDALFVGSVIRENGKTSFSVSNDTGRERKLRIITSRDVYDYTMEAGATRASLEAKQYSSFSQLPEDRLFTINEACDYALCLDVTDEDFIKQIRFVNFTDNDVYLEQDCFGTKEQRENDVILSGSCGKNVTFTLTKDYVLTVSGNGMMQDYHSKLLPPWTEYKDFIKKIVVEEGVESIGNQAFMGCYALDEVVLGDGIKEIRDKSFRYCTTLHLINLPESLTRISTSAFEGVAKKDLLGPTEEPGNEEPGGKNGGTKAPGGDKTGAGEAGGIATTTAVKDPSSVTDTNPEVLKAGALLKDPKTGFIYKVRKVKTVPELTLYRIDRKMKKIKVKSSIRIDGKKYKVIAIGSKAFQKTKKKVESVTIAKGIKSIGKNAFKGCGKLKKITSKNKKFTKRYLVKRGGWIIK